MLISYENEAISARAKGADVDYIVPDQSVLIENPAAVTKTAPKAAKKFLDFVESTQGQEIFASKGFRPVVTGTKIGTVKGANDPGNPFPQVKQLTTIAELGGWKVVNDKFFGDNGHRHEDREVRLSMTLQLDDAPAAPSRVPPALPPSPRAAVPGPEGPAAAGGFGQQPRHHRHLDEPARAAAAGGRGRQGVRIGGWSGFSDAITEPATASALKLTVSLSIGVAVVNAVMGTLVAWVLVRERFRGSAIFEMVIDIPFALPTIVAGLVMLALYGGAHPIGPNLVGTRTGLFVTLLFVTLPFTVRTVQPVLLDLDRDAEQAASLARRQLAGRLPAHRAAAAAAGHPLRRHAVLRPGARRVRLAGAHLQQHPVQDRHRRPRSSTASCRTPTTRDGRLSRPRRSRPCCCCSAASCWSPSTWSSGGRPAVADVLLAPAPVTTAAKPRVAGAADGGIPRSAGGGVALRRHPGADPGDGDLLPRPPARAR